MIKHSLETEYQWRNRDGFHLCKTVTVHEFASGVEIFINEAHEAYSDVDMTGECPEIDKRARGEGCRATSKERAARRAKTAVRRRCKAIQADCMLTLTYRELVTDVDRVQADVKALVKRLRTLGEFEYVATLEEQKRGALHVHMACQQFPAFFRNEQGVRVRSFALISSMWSRIVGRGNGNVNFTRPRGKNSAHRIASYISKYVGKGIEMAVLNAKSYWASKGIVIPRPVRLWFSGDTSTQEIVLLLVEEYLVRKGLVDVAQYASYTKQFHWFSFSKPG